MKAVIYAPEALARLEELYDYGYRTWGAERADAYYDRLIGRLEALATGELPRARPCGLLFRHEPDAEAMAGLSYYREGSHYLILRETADTIELASVLHESMDLESHVGGIATGHEGAGEGGEE